MITVRFPTGFSVQYNSATFVDTRTESYRLLTEKDGKLVARVPLGCIIEFVPPCRTYNPVASDSDKVQASVELIAKDLRSLKREIAKAAKP